MGDETIQTYDVTAAAFADQHWRTRLAIQMSSFLRWVPPGALVLDLGCGPGRDSAWLAEMGRCAVGLDRSGGMLREALTRAPRARFGQADLRALPLADGCAAGAWMCAAILHLPRADAAAALAEAHRVLALGAPLFVNAQQGDGEVWREGPNGRRFFCLWRPDDLTAAVRDAGFEVVAAGPEAGSTVWTAVLARRR